ncbi:hypothetical protein [Pseudomonas tremae]|nr:hypothetical protein [Pseudomonas tremae]MCF5713086.1 hypothetical protein [Pseudomonas tremae]MCF5746747.1 hypothetical protein [Pseudomonas tremae]UQB37949.1 hypothetical protein I9H09_06185 [Pseudomonas tremae]
MSLGIGERRLVERRNASSKIVDNASSSLSGRARFWAEAATMATNQ